MTAALVAAPLAASAPARAQFFWSGPRYSADDAARIAIQHGFRVLQRPARNDEVYVAEIVDRRGNRGRLVISGETGEVVQRSFYQRGRPDNDLPPGPVPPGRIPNDERRPGFFARLFGNDDGDRQERPTTRSERPAVPEDEVRPRQRPPRPRTAEQAPLDTVRPAAPVESRPLAPPSAAPSLPPRVATPRPTTPAPTQASLPPASAPAAAAPATPGRAISTNPLAIPGSREQDERSAKPSEAKVEPARSAEPAKPKPAAVPVAPLE